FRSLSSLSRTHSLSLCSFRSFKSPLPFVSKEKKKEEEEEEEEEKSNERRSRRKRKEDEERERERETCFSFSRSPTTKQPRQPARRRADCRRLRRCSHSERVALS